MAKCIFCQIRDGEIEKKFDFEDEDLMVFPDINPAKPIHTLIVPKKHMVDFMELNDSNLMKKINEMIKKSIKKEGLTSKGFSISTNGGGFQIIDHLHFHVKGPMGRNENIL
jgi:histidine triad (HIT) family protein